MAKNRNKQPQNDLTFGNIPGTTTGGSATPTPSPSPFDQIPGTVNAPLKKPATPFKESPFEKDPAKKKEHEDWKRYSEAANTADVPGIKAPIRETLSRNGIADMRTQELTLKGATKKLNDYARSKGISSYDDKTITEAMAAQQIQLGNLEPADLSDLADMANRRRMAEDALDKMRKTYNVQDDVTKARTQKAQQEAKTKEVNEQWAKGLYAPKPLKRVLGPQGVPENTDMPATTGMPDSMAKQEPKEPTYAFSRADLKRTPEFKLEQRDDQMAAKRPEYVAVPFQYKGVKLDNEGMPTGSMQVSSAMVPSSMLGDDNAIKKVTEQEAKSAEFVSQLSPLTQLPIKPVVYTDDKDGEETFTGDYEIGDISQTYRQLDNEFLSKFTTALLTDKYLTGDDRVGLDAAQGLAFDLLKYMKSQSVDDGIADVIAQSVDVDSWRPLTSWSGKVDDYVLSRVKSPNVKRVYDAFKQRYQQLEQLNGAKRFYGKKLPKELFSSETGAIATRAAVGGATGFIKGAFGWIGKAAERMTDAAEAGTARRISGIGGPQSDYSEVEQENILWRFLVDLGTGRESIDPAYATNAPVSVPNVSELRQLLPQTIADNERAKVNPNLDAAAKAQTTVGTDTFIEQVVPAVTQLIGSMYAGPFKISSGTVLKASSFLRTSKVGQTIVGSKYMQQLGQTLHSLGPNIIPNAQAATEMAATMSMAHLLETFPNANPEELEQSAISGALFPIVGNLITQRVFMPLVTKWKSVQGVLENPTTQAAYRLNLIEKYGPQKGMEIYGKSVDAARVQKELAYTLGNIFGNPAQGAIVANLTGQEYDGVAFVLDAVLGLGASGHLAKSIRGFNRPLDARDIQSFIRARETEEAIADAKRFARDMQGDTSPIADQVNAKVVEDIATDSEAPMATPEDAQAARETGETVENIEPPTDEQLNEQYTKEYEEVLRERFDADRAVLDVRAGEATPVKLSEMTNQEAFSDGFSDIQREALNLIHRNAPDTDVIYHPGPDTYYDSGTGTIYVSESLRGTEGERNALLHEGIHAATVETLRKDPAFRDQILMLKQKIEESTLFQKWMSKEENWEKALYMMQSPEEFIAGIVDNVNGVADVIMQESQGFGRRTIDTIKGAFNRDAMTNTDVFESVQDVLRAFPRMEVVKTADPQPFGVINDTFAQAMGDQQPQNAELFDQMTNGLGIDFILDDHETLVDPDSNLGLFKDLAKAINLASESVDKNQARTNSIRFIDNLRRYGIEDEVGYKFITDGITEKYADWDNFTPLRKSEILLQESKKLVADTGIVSRLKALTKERVDFETDLPASEIARRDTISMRDLSTVLGMKSVKRLQKWINANFEKPEFIIETINKGIDKRIDDLFGPVEADAEVLADNTEREAMVNSFREKANEAVRSYIFNNHNLLPVAPLELSKDVNGKVYLNAIESKDGVSAATGRKLVTAIQNPVPMFRRLKNIAEGLKTSSAGKPYRLYKDKGIDVLIDQLTNVKVGVVTDSKMLENNGFIKNSENVANVFLNDVKPGWFFLPGTAEGNMWLDLSSMFTGKPNPNTLSLLTKKVETINLVDYLDSEQTWGKPGANAAVPRVLAAFDLWKLVDMANKGEYFDLTDPKSSILKGLANEIYDVNKQGNEVGIANWFQAAMSDAPTLATQANEVITKLAKYYEANEVGVKPQVRHKIDGDGREPLVSALTEFYHKLTDYGNQNTIATKPGSDKPIKNTNKYKNVAIQASYNHYKDVNTLETILKSRGKLIDPLDLNKIEPENRETVRATWKQKGVILGDDGSIKLKQFILTDAWAEANPEIWAAISNQEEAVRKPSDHFDGGTLLINKATHDFLAEAYNKSADTTGGLKFGYGGDWIWKSALSEQYDTGNPLVDTFFQNLRDRGISMVAMQSAIKSKGKNFQRQDVLREGASMPTRYVYDHNGTLLGAEENGQYKGLTPEESIALHANGNVDVPGAIREYDLVGDNAFGFNHVASAPDENSFRGVSVSFDRSPYVYGDQGGVLRKTVRGLHSRIAEKFGRTIKADKMLLATAPLSQDRIFNELQSVVNRYDVAEMNLASEDISTNPSLAAVLQFPKGTKKEVQNIAKYITHTLGGNADYTADVYAENIYDLYKESEGNFEQFVTRLETYLNDEAPIYVRDEIGGELDVLPNEGGWDVTPDNANKIANDIRLLATNDEQFISTQEQEYLDAANSYKEYLAGQQSRVASQRESILKDIEDIKKVYNHDNGTVRNKDLYKYVKSLLAKAQESEPGSDLFATPEIKRAIVRGIENSLLDDNIVAVRNLHLLDAIYGNVIHGENTLRQRVITNEFDASRKAKSLGKLFRLNLYVPADNHVEDGADISRMWARIAAEEEAAKLELSDEDAFEFINDKVREHDGFVANEVVAKHIPDGKLKAYDQGVILSVNDIDAYNRHVQKQRAQGKDIPYLLMGSKVVTKLNPPDGLDSYSARVLVGADSRKGTGIMVNHEFLTQEIGRDFDGDDFGILFENPDWGGKYLDLWDELAKQGSHKGDPAKKQELGKNLLGMPFPKIPVDQRQQSLDNFNKTQEANSVGQDKIDHGIAQLNTWYEAWGYIEDRNRGAANPVVQTNRLRFTIGGSPDQWRVADAYTKQAQYDTWAGLPYHPRDVFFGSRVMEIEIGLWPNHPQYKEYANAIRRYKDTGTVVPLLMEEFYKAYKSNVPTKSTDSVVAAIPQYVHKNEYSLAKYNDGTVYGAGIDATIAQYQQMPEGLTEGLIDATTRAINAEPLTKQYKYIPGNVLKPIESTLATYQNLSNNTFNNIKEVLNTLYYASDTDTQTKDRLKAVAMSFKGLSAVDARFDFVSNISADPIATGSNAIFTSTPDNPNHVTNQLVLTEMLQRAYGQSKTTIEIPGADGVRWNITDESVVLQTPHAEYGIEEIYTNGDYSDGIKQLMEETGLTADQLFPPHLIMPAVMDKREVSLRNMPNELTKLGKENPNTVFLLTHADFQNFQDGWSQGYKPEPNVIMVNRGGKSDAGVTKEIKDAIAQQTLQGKRVVLLNWGHGTKRTMPNKVDPSILDSGAALRIDRNMTDRQRIKMLGKYAAFMQPSNPDILLAAMQQNLSVYGELQDKDSFGRPTPGYNPMQSLDKHYYSGMRDIYEGAKEVGGDVTIRDGQDLLQSLYQDTIYYSDVKALHNMQETDSIDKIPGVRFGLYNGEEAKIEGYKLQNQRAGRLNRLNKFVGKPLAEMSWKETEEVNNTISEYLRSEFGEGANANELYDFVMSAIDPQQLRTIEEGLYRKYGSMTQMEENGDTRGNNIIRASKSFYLAQALTDAMKITDKQAKVMGVAPRTWWDRFQILASQEAPEFIKHYAKDKKNHSLFTPVSETIGVTVDEFGNVSETVTSNILGSQYNQQMMPKYASMESETYVRHGYRKRSINAIKDKMAADLSGLRDNLKDRFEPIGDAGILEAAREISRVSTAVVQASSVFNGVNDPSVSIKVGNKIYNADSNGYIPDAELNSIAEDILNGVQQENIIPQQYTRQNLVNALKIAVTAKVQNQRYATYQRNIAASLEAYVRNLYEENTPNEVVPLSEEELAAGITPMSAKPDIETTEFAPLWQQAKTIADELRSEADARLKSGLVDNINAMQFVNYDTFSDVVTESLTERDALVDKVKNAPAKQRAEAKQELDDLYRSYSQYFDVLRLAEQYPTMGSADPLDRGKIVMSYLQSRRDSGDRKNKQLSKVSSFFKRELLGSDEHRPAMYDTRDYEIMKYVYGTADTYNEDLLFQRNQDVLQSTFLNINSLFTNSYNAERNIRKALGKSTLDNTVAENNLLSMFSTDGTIYKENVDVHSTRGWRAKMKEVANEGRAWLSSDEIGLPVTTPVAITYTADSNNNIKTLTGRLAGVVRLDPKIVATRNVKEAQMRFNKQKQLLDTMLNKGTITAEQHKLDLSNLEQSERKLGLNQKAVPKDVMVVYNQENGSLSYIDLETVTQVQKGSVNGWLANKANDARQKEIYKIFGEERELGEFLSSVNAEALQSFTGEKVRETYKVNDPQASINFYSKLGRENVPNSLVAALDKTSQIISSGASQWRYGFGKETATILASVLAAPVIGVGGAAAGVGWAIYKGTSKYVRNKYGNYLGFALRASQIFPQLFDSEALPDTWGAAIKMIGKNFSNQVTGTLKLLSSKETDAYMREGTPAASTAKQRLQKGAGLAAELITPANTQSTNRGTRQYVEMLNEGKRVKKIIDGLGRYLTANDMDQIQQVIDKNMRYAKNVKATIRQGQLNLTFTETNKAGVEEYIASLDEIQAMNLDRLNQALALSGKTLSFLDPLLVTGSRALIEANNLRLRVFNALGETEQKGVMRAGSTATKAFERLQEGKDVRSNPAAISSYVEQGIESLQGKFDEKAYHLQTPFGRAYNLFSQYFRRFARRTTLDPVNEYKFWDSWYKIVGEDQEFASVMMGKYGLDLGDQVAQRTFTAWSPDDGPQALRMSIAGKMAFTPLAVMGFGQLLNILIESLADDNAYELKRDMEQNVEMVLGGENPVGNAVKTIVEGVSLFATRDLEKASTAQAVEYNLRDLANIVPGGAGITPAFDAGALLGLYAMHKAGILPNMPSDMRWERRVANLLGPIGIPLQAPGDVVSTIEKGGKVLKGPKNFIGNLVGEEIEEPKSTRRRKPRRKKPNADSK
jgi:hypothetical protein